MPSYKYHRVDVFSNHPLGGNPLAVFPEAKGISSDDMQRIAREMNLSETVFVLPPRIADTDLHLRIFTVDREVDLAGHPVVGAVYVLSQTGQIAARPPCHEVRLELGAGVLPAEVVFDEGEISSVVMTQKLPSFGEPFLDRDLLARALGVDKYDLFPADLPARSVDTGIPWFLIPLSGLRTIRQLQPDPAACRELAELVGTDMFYAFTQDVEDPVCAVRGRHVWFGTVTPNEDPVTGSASGCLASYLVHHEVLLAHPTADIRIEQGHEVGRPGIVEALIRVENGQISRVQVGGPAVHVGDGELRF